MPYDLWLILLNLEFELHGSDSVLQVVTDSRRYLSVHQNLSAIYQRAAELLVLSKRVEVAISLLNEGIGFLAAEKTSPLHQSRAELVQACAKLMEESGQEADAIELLQEAADDIRAAEDPAVYFYTLIELTESSAGIMSRSREYGRAIDLLEHTILEVGTNKNVFILYQTEIELIGLTGDCPKAEQIIARGLAAIPASNGRYRVAETGLRVVSACGGADAIKRLVNLGPPSQLGAQQHAIADYMLARTSGDWQKALEVIQKGRARFPTYGALLFHEADAHLALGQTSEAYALVTTYDADVHQGRDHPPVWLKALVSLVAGHPEEAKRHAAMFAAGNFNAAVALDEAEMLRLWAAARGGGIGLLVNAFPGVAHYLTRSGPHAPSVVAPSIARPSRQPSVLAVATEWHSAHGGVSTFNRELCRAFAKEGYKVWCYVPDAKLEEITQAKDNDGVIILSAPREAHANQDARLRNRPALPAGAVPDLIISHDRITGPAATSLVENHFPNSKHILFIHTAPKQIEWFKEQGDDTTATGSGELRRQLQISLARKAYLVAGVGPKLQNAMANELHALTPSKTAVEFLPGLETPFQPASPPPANECLVLGRAEDADLKGLDIASRAMAKLLITRYQAINPPPVLVVRGAPVGTGDTLRNGLMQKTHLGANHLHIREYSSDVDVVRRDMLSSAVVLMPSRTEGFGLAALEAIALGIPVLVSDQSGLAETLRMLAPNHLKRCIVHVTADLETDAAAWEREIDFVLSDRNAAFVRANELRNALAPHFSWQQAVRGLIGAISINPG